MADTRNVLAASGLIDTGKGVLAGLVITCSSSTAALATFYDNTAGSGTKILEGYVSSTHPLVIFFSDRFAPIYATGLYLLLAANLTATVWTRQV
jgi:hypothetical protein